MKKTLRPGISAYLPLGLISAGLVVLYLFVWVVRGPQTNAWQPIVLVVGVYLLWCLSLWRRVIVLDEGGIRCTYLMRKARSVTWSEIDRSVMVNWIDRKPYQVLIFGQSAETPLMELPLRLYHPTDVELLLNMDGLKLEVG